MARSDRPLPQSGRVPWREFQGRAKEIFGWLQAGWTALSQAEREEVRRLVSKSRGRPRNLTRDDTRRLGRLAAKAASAARSQRRR
jgi:alkylhydroperoxidase family enzyme